MMLPTRLLTEESSVCPPGPRRSAGAGLVRRGAAAELHRRGPALGAQADVVTRRAALAAHLEVELTHHRVIRADSADQAAGGDVLRARVDHHGRLHAMAVEDLEGLQVG